MNVISKDRISTTRSSSCSAAGIFRSLHSPPPPLQPPLKVRSLDFSQEMSHALCSHPIVRGEHGFDGASGTPGTAQRL